MLHAVVSAPEGPAVLHAPIASGSVIVIQTDRQRSNQELKVKYDRLETGEQVNKELETRTEKSRNLLK